MRKRAKKLLALLTAVTVVVTGVNVPTAQAAKKKTTVKVSKTTLIVNGTKSQKKATITVKNAKKKITYKLSKAGKKIVKLSKKSGKKITVTAKKVGKATITIKEGKKTIKKVKMTVKKKSTKPTAKPTVAPTKAPTAAPTQAPSDAPSDAPSQAPSDTPTAAPSADPSAAPSADPSAAPSETPEPEASKVTEIKITSKEALTNKEGNRAYVTYDVLDQYGKSMRESASIRWSTSPADPTDDKTNGQLTFTKDSEDSTAKFTYGDLIVITGVYSATGVTVSEQVKVGLARAVDTVTLEGYLCSDDATKVLDTLPATFGDGIKTYELLFQAKDQNGTNLDLQGGDFDPSQVTFISDNPLIAGVDSAAAKVKTVKGVDYIAVPFTQGINADKGDVVNVTAIAQNTGTKSTFSITIGSTGVLGSLDIQAPAKSVYDGDKEVELPYVAKDTNGVETTDYKTIVRSSNKLLLNVTDGEIRIIEQKDGSAKIYWYDKYQRTNPAEVDAKDKSTYAYNKDNPTCYDGVDRMINISTVVVGGDNHNNMMSVKDAPVPQKVVPLVDEKMLAGNTTDKVWTITEPNWDGTIKYTDMSIKSNYGITMAAKEAYEFMKYFDYGTAIDDNDKTFDGDYYGFIKGTIEEPSDDLVSYAANKWTIPVNHRDVKDITKEEDKAWTESFGIRTKDAKNEKAKASFTAAATKIPVTLVAVRDLTNVAIKGLDSVLEYKASKEEDWKAEMGTSLKADSAGTWKFLVSNGDGKYYINTDDEDASMTGDKLIYMVASADDATGVGKYIPWNTIAWAAQKPADGWASLPCSTVKEVMAAVDNSASQGYINNNNGTSASVDSKLYSIEEVELVADVASGETLNSKDFTLRDHVKGSWWKYGYTVKGTYKGTELDIPASYYVADESSQIKEINGYANNGFSIPSYTIAHKDAVDLKDTNLAYTQYKKFVVKFALLVTPETSAAVVVKPYSIKKNVTATLEDQVVTTVNGWVSGSDSADLTKITNPVSFTAVDQYGYDITTAVIDPSIVDYVESTDARLTFKSGVQISGTDVIGAELGDKFGVRGIVAGTDIETTVSVTLGADKSAYFSSAKSDAEQPDAALVKALQAK